MNPLLRRILTLSAILSFVGCGNQTAQQSPPALTIYCAAGLRNPLESVAAAFQEECGIKVQFQFGGSGTLLSQIKVSRSGDLLIAADDSSIDIARKAETAIEVIPFATQTPVIAVKTGNPKSLKTFSDLFAPALRLALANPEAASIGKSVRKAAADRWEALATKTTVMKPTVTEIAADLSLGAVDAAVIWDSLTTQFSDLEGIHIPELDAQTERASAAVLSASTHPADALKFARFLAAPEKGGAILATAGYKPISGDRWSPKPELTLYSGGVNRPAVEALLTRFATREGIGITTVINGCGVLCATMKTMGSTENPKYPDAYYACDLCFVPPVAEQFPESILLTETEIGIVVREGNPKGIRTLADLAQPNVRVGLCNAEQSTLGYMTRGILKSSGLWESVHKNVVVEVPTADFLVNQMRAGALDAAIVYSVNTKAGSAQLEFHPILHAGAKAIQPFAVRGDSPNRQLALRLLDYLKNNRSEFEKAGFKWRGNEAPIESKSIEIPSWLKDK
ncbi:MAG: molybdate ABC transporter substrate-binding protein [Verrucomicrobiota bacterium]